MNQNVRSKARGLGLAALVALTVLCEQPFTAHSFSGDRKDPADPFERVSDSDDVPWLERIAGSLAEAEKLRPRGGLARQAKDLRTAAYARLGELGTKASLAALERVEKKAKGGTLTPTTVALGVWTHPAFHWSDTDVNPLAQVRTPGGATYAVVRSTLLGGFDLFLTFSKTPEDKGSWSRPRLIPGKTSRTIREPSLTARGPDVLVLSYVQERPGAASLTEGSPDSGKRAPSVGLQKLEIAVSDVVQDRDGDGWSDVEERRLGLDPTKADTDGDGIPDGTDPCPSFAPPKGHDGDEEVQILQKAVFATLGLSDSRHLLIVGPKSRKVQIWGYRGPVIYVENPQDWRKEHGYGAVFVDWQVTRKGDQADVSIGDYEGAEAGGLQYIHLKKVEGRWIVTKRKVGLVK